MTIKLPEWPALHNTFAAKLADAEIAYWEARCRLLYAEMGRYAHHDLACPMQIFNGSTHCNCDSYYAMTALRDCGPLPEHRT